MTKAYHRQNLLQYLSQAKDFLEAQCVPDFEKYLSAISIENPVFGYLDAVLFIVDLKINKIVYVSDNAFEVEGYTAEELKKLSATGYIELMHPLDAEIMVNKVFVDGMSFTSNNPNLPFDKFKVSYNYRLKQKNGKYKMLMQQFSYLMVDELQNPLMLIGTVTDISDLHHKPELFCRITKQNSKGKWDKIFERFYSLVENKDSYKLSSKEMEIIKFVHQGLSSKEIANLTGKSIETINTQRKSILSKTGCKSLTEVIVLAKENGWI
ncbi:MAG: LuxR C-terminal-related transcriptional regulator [Flavobacteriales bacterium]